jgi:hypothetical protein
MPVLDLQEARDLDRDVGRLLDAASPAEAVQRLRDIFVGRLDLAADSGTVPLRGNDLPSEAIRIARREGVFVVAVTLHASGRVRASDIRAALKELRASLGGDVLLAITEQSRSQWHFVYPTYEGGPEVLRRMVVQRDQPRRTVVQQIAGIYKVMLHADLRAALERAYDVEAVTKEFFSEYRRVFERVEAGVRGLPGGERRRMFVQRLFNRLMFIAFVQRKGWMRWDGDTDYLAALWRDYQRDATSGKNFYHNRLIALFFGGLNNEINVVNVNGGGVLKSLIGEVPYLNGGLFEQEEDDRNASMVVPDDCIDAILNDLLARFNFTVMESTPWDVEVAVDPEMLGKVFEELVTGRHETGSYYTRSLWVPAWALQEGRSEVR